jgi:heme-degrading monooxygenase HmoA
MILRVWRGRTSIEDGDAYEKFMIDRAAPDYTRVEGLKKLYFARRDDAQGAHFLLITLWESIEAAAAFAGADPDRAKYYPEDDRFLLEKDPLAENFRMFHAA